MLLFQVSIITWAPDGEETTEITHGTEIPGIIIERTDTGLYGTGRAGIMTTTEKECKHGAVIRTNPGHDSPRKNQGCRLFRGIIREWNPNIINKSGNINKGSLSSDGTIRQGLKGSASLVFNNHGFRFNSRGFAIRRDNR